MSKNGIVPFFQLKMRKKMHCELFDLKKILQCEKNVTTNFIYFGEKNLGVFSISNISE